MQAPRLFISSVHRHLADYRSEAFKIAENNGWAPFGSEKGSGPAPGDPASVCLERVRAAGALLVIVGFSYGSLVPDDEHDRSYSELEFDEAIRLQKPMFVMMAISKDPLPRETIDPNPDRINRFRKKIEDTQTSGRYTCQRFNGIPAFREFLSNTLKPDFERIAPKNSLPLKILHNFTGPPRLVGREADIGKVDEWFNKTATPCLFVKAIGGMGKSSLLWHWFNDQKTKEKLEQSGALWFSCYGQNGTLADLGVALCNWLGERRGEEHAWSIADKTLRARKDSGLPPPLLLIDGLETAFFTEQGRVQRKPQSHASPASIGTDFYEAVSSINEETQFRAFVDARSGQDLGRLLRNGLLRLVASSRYIPSLFETMEIGHEEHRLGYLERTETAEEDPILVILREALHLDVSAEDIEPLSEVRALYHPLRLIRFGHRLKNDIEASTEPPGQVIADIVKDNEHLSNSDITQQVSGIFDYSMRGLHESELLALQILAVDPDPIEKKAFRKTYDKFAADRYGENSPKFTKIIKVLQNRGLLDTLKNSGLLDVRDENGDGVSFAIDPSLRAYVREKYPDNMARLAREYRTLNPHGDRPAPQHPSLGNDRSGAQREARTLLANIRRSIDIAKVLMEWDEVVAEVDGSRKEAEQAGLDAEWADLHFQIWAALNTLSEDSDRVAGFENAANGYSFFYGLADNLRLFSRLAEARQALELASLCIDALAASETEFPRASYDTTIATSRMLIDLDEEKWAQAVKEFLAMKENNAQNPGNLAYIYIASTISKFGNSDILKSIIKNSSFDYAVNFDSNASTEIKIHQWYLSLRWLCREAEPFHAFIFDLYNENFDESPRVKLLNQTLLFDHLCEEGDIEGMRRLLQSIDSAEIWRSIDFRERLHLMRFDLDAFGVTPETASPALLEQLRAHLHEYQFLCSQPEQAANIYRVKSREAIIHFLAKQPDKARNSFAKAALALVKIGASRDSHYWRGIIRIAKRCGWEEELARAEELQEPFDFSPVVSGSLWGYSADIAPPHHSFRSSLQTSENWSAHSALTPLSLGADDSWVLPNCTRHFERLSVAPEGVEEALEKFLNDESQTTRSWCIGTSPPCTIRVWRLPFYPQASLVEALFTVPFAEGHALASFVAEHDPSGKVMSLVHLDGTSPPIHELNPKFQIDLTDEKVALAYLRFFCAHVWGEDGGFWIIDSIDDILLRQPITDAVRQQLKDAIKPPRFMERTDTGFRFEVTLKYEQQLFSAIMTVQSRGLVEMEEDNPFAFEVQFVKDVRDALRFRCISELQMRLSGLFKDELRGSA